MAAELHLAEYALALHLLLERLQGLVDVVVADENLHASFPLDRLRSVGGKMIRASRMRRCLACAASTRIAAESPRASACSGEVGTGSPTRTCATS
jgi:hypothetical protein